MGLSVCYIACTKCLILSIIITKHEIKFWNYHIWLVSIIINNNKYFLIPWHFQNTSYYNGDIIVIHHTRKIQCHCIIIQTIFSKILKNESKVTLKSYPCCWGRASYSFCFLMQRQLYLIWSNFINVNWLKEFRYNYLKIYVGENKTRSTILWRSQVYVFISYGSRYLVGDEGLCMM